jgi:phage shock protein A
MRGTHGRMKSKVRHREAAARAHAELVSDDVNAKFAAMEKQEEIDRPPSLAFQRICAPSGAQ